MRVYLNHQQRGNEMAYKQVKLLPMSDRVLEKMLDKEKELYPNKKINKQGLVNELILKAAINMGIE